jgi:hypothetical protein
MTYTAPTTRSAGDLITHSIWNTDVVDNIAALKNPPVAVQLVNEGADYTTTSTTFVDIDGTDLAKTITTYGGDVLLIFTATIAMQSTDNNVYLDFTVDGSRVGGDAGLVATGVTRDGQLGAITMAYLVTSLAAGEHTFKVQWRTTAYGGASTAKIWAGAGSTTASTGQTADLHPFFLAREL